MSRATRVALAVLLLAGLAFVYQPVSHGVELWREDRALDHLVRVVALDWRDFGEDKAVERLEFELDRQSVGPHVKATDCRLGADPDGRREVSCAWEAIVAWPALSLTLPLSFQSEAHITPEGHVRW